MDKVLETCIYDFTAHILGVAIYLALVSLIFILFYIFRKTNFTSTHVKKMKYIKNMDDYVHRKDQYNADI